MAKNSSLYGWMQCSRMSKKEMADCLMSKDAEIWEKMGITSAGDFTPRYGGSIKKWHAYQKQVEGMLKREGFCNGGKRVPDDARATFEDQNYHSLNQAIDFLPKCRASRQRWGLTKKQFMKRT